MKLGSEEVLSMLTCLTAEAKNEKFMAFGDLGDDDEDMEMDADGAVEAFGTEASDNLSNNEGGDGISPT